MMDAREGLLLSSRGREHVERAKGFSSTNRPDVTDASDQSEAQQGHVVVGKFGAPLGVQFRCVILTLALYQFVDEDRT